jgi:hypothetical protein
LSGFNFFFRVKILHRCDVPTTPVAKGTGSGSFRMKKELRSPSGDRLHEFFAVLVLVY